WRKADLAPFDARLAERRTAFEAGESFKPRKAIRLAEYAEHWFDELYATAEAGRISKLTYNTYEGSWRNHLHDFFGHLPLAAIDAALIRRYVSARQTAGLAAVTINNSLTPLSAMLTDAVDDGLIVTNAARQPRRARQ